jgi:hypothetical protein
MTAVLPKETTMSDRSEAALRAEAKFKKNEQAKQESEKVWAELEAANRAADEKRARLRHLRLAKEAAEEANRVSEKARPKASKPVKMASEKARAQTGPAKKDANDTAGRAKNPVKRGAGTAKAKPQAPRSRTPRSK